MSSIGNLYVQVYKIIKRLKVKTGISCNHVKIWCSGFLLHSSCIEKTGQNFKFSSQYYLSICNESWTIKKADHWRTDTLKLWCWWRLLRVPWIAGRSSQSILKEISPKDWCWSWNSNTLATWCKKADSFVKNLILGKNEGRRRRGQQRMRWLDGITDSMDMSLSKLRELVMDREAWHAGPWGCKELDMTEEQNWLNLMPSKNHEVGIVIIFKLNRSSYYLFTGLESQGSRPDLPDSRTCALSY